MKFNINIRIINPNNLEKWMNQVEQISSRHDCVDQVTIDVVEGIEDMLKQSFALNAPTSI